MIFNLMKPVPVQTATMYLYGHEADKTVTYNGVELPPLPVWDKVSYPYAVLFQLASSSTLLCTSEPITYGTTIMKGFYVGTTFLSSSTLTEDENGDIVANVAFREFTVNEETDGYISRSGYGTLYWSNHDIVKEEDGTVYLSASEPVTTYTNADVYIDGVGYVGAVLPKLPEWDKTAYPYAVIQIGEDVHSFMISTVPLYYKKTSEDICGRENGTSWEYLLSDNPNNYFGGVPGEWTRVKETFEIEKDSYIYDFVSWSNYDILNEDGTTYLSASDPVPVYE